MIKNFSIKKPVYTKRPLGHRVANPTLIKIIIS